MSFLSEGSSLTGRETVTVLGRAVTASKRWRRSGCRGTRFSRYFSRLHRSPQRGEVDRVRLDEDGALRLGMKLGLNGIP
jgi:hypothetical protein